MKRGITLTFCPRACAYFRNTLIAPVNWICLVWSKAVAVNEARVTLYVWKEKRVRQNISSQKFQHKINKNAVVLIVAAGNVLVSWTLYMVMVAQWNVNKQVD